MSVRVETRGPLLDGSAPGIVDDLLEELEREVADEGVALVRQRLDQVLRRPTGYYRSRVTAANGRVTDSNVVYGPWLEGVSSRNRSSRFRGYATFRKTTQELDRRVPELAQRVLPTYVGRLNG